jgi:drug/metabolite transporter (DMT)-like permease
MPGTAQARRRTGLAIASITAVVSGFAVFINGYGVRAWNEISDPTTYTTIKNLVAAAVLLCAAAVATRRRSPASLTRPRTGLHWLGLGTVAIVGGSIPFALFFEGLARASSSQAAFIHKTLVVWVGVMAVLILKERVEPLHFAAIALLVAGQLLVVGGIGDIGFGGGEWMIAGATLFWSVEVIIAKRLLAEMSSLTVGVARMAGGAVLLLGWGIVDGGLAAITGLTTRHIGWVLVTGVVLSAYVGSWYAALARAQAVDVTAILVGGAVITALLRLGVTGTTLPSAAGLALVAGGAILAGVAASDRRLLAGTG